MNTGVRYLSFKILNSNVGKGHVTSNSAVGKGASGQNTQLAPLDLSAPPLTRKSTSLDPLRSNMMKVSECSDRLPASQLVLINDRHYSPTLYSGVNDLNPRQFVMDHCRAIATIKRSSAPIL